MFFVVLTLILIILGEFFYFMRQIGDNRSFILLLKRENEILKDKAKNSKKNYSSLEVKFSSPVISYGEIIANTMVFLSPLDTSPMLTMVNSPSKVKALCKAQIFDEIWYEISLEVSTNINSRGWVKSSSMIFNESKTLTNMY